MSLTVKVLTCFGIFCLHFHLLYIFNSCSKGLLTSFLNIQLPGFACKASSFCCFGGFVLHFLLGFGEGCFFFLLLFVWVFCLFVFKKLMGRCQKAKSLCMGSMNLHDLHTDYLILRRNSICLILDEICRTYRNSFC